AGQLSKEISGFMNAATNASENSCRVTEYDYTPVDPADTGALDLDTPRTVIEKLLGLEISRRYSVIVPGEHREIQCAAPGAAVNDTNNLVTITKDYAEGDERVWGKTRLLNYPDGTREVHFYDYFDSTNGSPSYVTNTVLRGEADSGNETNVLSGTRTVAVTTDTGHPISTKVFDIAYGILTASEGLR